MSIPRLTATVTVALLAALCLFYQLGNIEIAAWDESKHIVSALEMQSSGNYVINTYDNEPDYWTLKPLLGFWGVLAGLELCGHTIFASRFFSALASLGTMLLIFAFARRAAGTWAGLCAVLLCLGVDDIMIKHGLRSADADAFFIFFTTLALFSLSFMSLRGVCLAWLSLGLAFLCKSFHAAPFCLAAFIFTIYLTRQKKISLLSAIVAPFAFFIPVLPWAIVRYMFDGEKFLAAMFFNDVLKRGTQTIEGHQEAAYYFVRKLYSYFSVAYYALAGIFIYNHFKKVPVSGSEPQAPLLLLWLLVPLIFYSAAQSRLTWYIYPAVPALAILLCCLPIKMFNVVQARAVLLAIAIFSLTNQAVILKKLHDRSAMRTPEIAAVEEISRNYSGKGEIYLEDGVPWAPEIFAAAKLLTDLTPRGGGFGAFCQSKAEKKFFVYKDKETSEGLVLHNCFNTESMK